MTEEEKKTAAAAAKADADAQDHVDAGIAAIEDQRTQVLAAADEMDAMTPTPTQEENDRAKLGMANHDVAKAAGYKTRQARAN